MFDLILEARLRALGSTPARGRVLGMSAGDGATAAAARECRAQDESMAATIDGNWTNVLTLALAAKGLLTALRSRR